MNSLSAPPRYSRRSFLAAVSAGCGTLALRHQAHAEVPRQSLAAGAVVREGGLIRLTTRGRAYIAADFHARFGDFQRWLKTTRIVERIQGGEDVFGVLLGDVVDMKGGHPKADADGDVRIIAAFREAQTKLGKQGDRLILLQGNHEHDNVKLFQLLKENTDFAPRNRKAIVDELFASKKGAYYRQFNFLQRMTDDHFEFLKQLPVAVVMGNGVMAAHAGPSQTARSVDDIAEMKPRVVEELVWARPAAGRDTGYTVDELSAFLTRVKAHVLVSGHTPLPLLPGELARDGIVVYGNRQVILGTSYGAFPNQESYLVIDLARQYRDAADIKAGREILRVE